MWHMATCSTSPAACLPANFSHLSFLPPHTPTTQGKKHTAAQPAMATIVPTSSSSLYEFCGDEETELLHEQQQAFLDREATRSPATVCRWTLSLCGWFTMLSTPCLCPCRPCPALPSTRLNIAHTCFWCLPFPQAPPSVLVPFPLPSSSHPFLKSLHLHAFYESLSILASQPLDLY